MKNCLIKNIIWYILYAILCFTFGFVISLFISFIAVRVVTLAAMYIIQFNLYDAMNLYVLSGRMDNIMKNYTFIIAIVYNIVLFIIGSEIMTKHFSKQKNGDKLKDVKNQILFK